jgi:hypothetical protein
MGRRVALLVLLVLLGLNAPTAQAALLVNSDSTGLVVQSGGASPENFTVFTAPPGGNPDYVVENNNPVGTPKFNFRENCTQGSSDNRAVCTRLSGRLTLRVFDLDDQVRVPNSGASLAEAFLGSGNNLYVGINGPDFVQAGRNDNVDTRAGDDEIRIGSGQDEVDAGPGNDLVCCVSGEGVDRILLGSGNDRVFLRGTSTVTPERVSDGLGDDTVATGDSKDAIFGGACPSLGISSSTPTGGADSFSTGSGDDIICAKEQDAGVADTVRCGFGFDKVEVDLRDDFVDPNAKPSANCEEVARSPVGETPHVRILGETLRVSAAGRVRVRLRCPRGVRSLGCKGTLRLRLARTRKRGAQSSRSRRVRYSIRAGRRKTVALKLTRRDVRNIRRRQRRKLEARGILASVEKGRKGRKTTIRNPRLRLGPR